jgi:hypothetical protein
MILPLVIWMNSPPATSIVTQKMSLAIYAEIFGKWIRTDEDVDGIFEGLGRWRQGY